MLPVLLGCSRCSWGSQPCTIPGCSRCFQGSQPCRIPLFPGWSRCSRCSQPRRIPGCSRRSRGSQPRRIPVLPGCSRGSQPRRIPLFPGRSRCSRDAPAVPGMLPGLPAPQDPAVPGTLPLFPGRSRCSQPRRIPLFPGRSRCSRDAPGAPRALSPAGSRCSRDAPAVPGMLPGLSAPQDPAVPGTLPLFPGRSRCPRRSQPRSARPVGCSLSPPRGHGGQRSRSRPAGSSGRGAAEMSGKIRNSGKTRLLRTLLRPPEAPTAPGWSGSTESISGSTGFEEGTANTGTAAGSQRREHNAGADPSKGPFLQKSRLHSLV
ncbi:uncharacterized protein LOC128798387 [Vidua chalybeata]|uniref:uncharacterized protein LOC128798387 n=1 Tax=Vidua chalybeata TaxID=81927 RepID=UPI0023A8DD68|nr:uncharacterized protein LOC128798387 [Vidua chalybeata]